MSKRGWRDPVKERLWRVRLQRQEASGLSVREFCARNKLAESAIYAWRAEIQRRDRQSGTSTIPTLPARSTTRPVPRGRAKKHRVWDAAGRTDREPEKFHFVKGFHRGLELFGQHRLNDPANGEKLASLGLVLVEGPNDVIALDALGVPAVGLCSNTITREQAEKTAWLAIELAGGIITLMLDCDTEGENGVQQVLPMLAERVPVRMAWSSRMHGGRFKGRQPESLVAEELTALFQ
jgi:hypothetical protein